MATFTNFNPTINQTGVAQTTTVSVVVTDDAYGVQINTLNATIDGYQAITNGIFTNGYTGSIFHGTGKYVIGIYPKAPLYIRKAAEISVHYDVLDSYSTLDAYDYNFYTTGYNPIPPVPPTPEIENRACSKTKPFFPPTDLGLNISIDKGTGTEITLRWKVASPYVQSDVVYYNVYYSSDHDNVFTTPQFLAENTEITIGGIAPGSTNYFGIRGMEVNPLVFRTSGMIQAGTDFFFFPSSSAGGDISATDLFIPADTDGFPTSGVIQIDYETVRYTSLGVSPDGFVVPAVGRGYADTMAANHLTGSIIEMYRWKEDSNNLVSCSTTTFQKPNYSLTWVKSDGYGFDGYRDGYDGYGSETDGYFRYRQTNIDSVTTDGIANDASGTFSRYPHCGTWSPLGPPNYMKGQCVRSYYGGAQRRDGYMVKVGVMEQMLQREELLLESTGEPMVLLRRQWTGDRCLCFMNRREHADSRCPICYGTTFVQGYTQFINPRRSDRRILVRVDPNEDELKTIEKGLEPLYEPTCWTLPMPMLKTHDVLIRFNPTTNTEEFRYEILNVTRSKALFLQTGAQKFKMKRYPKTDIIYQFPAIRDASPYPTSIFTSTDSGPGMTAHFHYIMVPQGFNLVTLKVATQASQNHNHVVYDGIVQNVLGHTHTL